MHLLETYQERRRQIEVLRYELAHLKKVSDIEQIEAMMYGHGDGTGRSNMEISNKTYYTAINYEEQTERMNSEVVHEIENELFALETCQNKLMYYVNLLQKREADIVKMCFFENVPKKDIADRYGLTCRTIDRIKSSAVESLVEMYEYADRFE